MQHEIDPRQIQVVPHLPMHERIGLSIIATDAADAVNRIVEQRQRELQARNALNERVLRTVMHDLSISLTQLQRVSQQFEGSLLNPAGEELLEQSLTEMKRSLQKLEELGSYVQEALQLWGETMETASKEASLDRTTEL